VDTPATPYAEIARKHGIVLLYLFGSRAKGTAAPGSDWDVAVLVEGSGPADPHRFAAEVERDLQPFSQEAVEVTVLNGADPILSFQVISTGRILHARTERERVLYEARVLREYRDSAHRRRIFADAARAYFTEGRG
jgi:predicted nucleotidyltransferase